MKRIVNQRITVIGIAVFLFLVTASAVSGQSASDKKKAEESNKRGINYYKNGNYDQAITEFTEAIRLNPKMKDAYFNRGFSYYRINNFDQAIEDYGKAIQLDPKYVNAYYNRGRAYNEIKDFDRAIADYDKVIQLDPKAVNAYNNCAWIYAYHLKKDFDRAISYANQAVRLSPNNASVYDTRGWAYLGNGDFDKAIADFEKSLQINSDNTSSREGLAQARLAQIKPEPVKDEDFEVKQNADNTVTITNYKGKARNVEIPATLYGLKVTIIGNKAFMKKGLISVVIPDTVVTIENTEEYGGILFQGGVFSYNEELVKVTLGKGLKTIGSLAFSGSQLTEIIIPDSVTEIRAGSFSNAGLIKVTFGKGLQTIGDSAFQGNEIVELNLPSSLKKIGAAAFYKNKIQKITFGTGLQEIGSSAFRYNQITELNNLPSSLKTIQGGAFANNQIQSLTIPNGVTTISPGIYGDPEYSNTNYNLGAFVNNPITTLVIPASLANGDFSGAFSSYKDERINSITTTFTRITIPAKMDEKCLKDNFEEAFVNFWINQNRAGGTYVKRGPIWTKE